MGDDGNGVNQSAFEIIKNKLTAKPAVQKEPAIDMDVLADKIVQKMEQKKEENKEPDQESAWDSFFNGGK